MIVRRMPGSVLWGFVFCLVLALPALAWVFISRHAFGGDQSQYASATLELYRAWTLAPQHWADTMIHSVGFKAPGIAWLGQVFVLLGRHLGSVDAALLLSIVATQTIALMMMFGTLWTLSDRSLVVSSAGCLVIGISPLFQVLSHEYLVEPLQLLSAAWFLLILAHAPRWNRALTLAQLVMATSVAMLAKASSPLYCLVPALASAGFVLGIGSATPWGWGRPATAVAWIAGTLLAVGTACWYFHNISAVVRHVGIATSGPIAAVWGKEDSFLITLGYWVDAIVRFFFLTPSLLLAVLLVVAGFAGYLLRPEHRKRHFTFCCVLSILQIALVLMAFSFSSNREPRYLLALLPQFALIVGWGMAHIVRPTAMRLGAAALVSVWALASAHGLRLFDVRWSAFGPVPRVHTQAYREIMIREVVARTCADETPTPYFNIIAIDPSLKGDWLAPAPADYVAAREHLGSRSGVPCSYGYAGDGFFGSDAARAWASLSERRPRYIVTFDPGVYPPSEKAYNQTLNKQNFPIFYERLATSRDFERLAPLSGDPGILIFRRSEGSADQVVAAQSGKLAISTNETRRLFGLMSEKKLGDVHGLAEMRESGILVHPGATTPTHVSFDVAGRYGNITLVAFIASLPPEALATKTAGTVGVEFSVDGKSVGRAMIDRAVSYERTLDLKDAKTLSITVDNSDGSPWWDWLIIAVK